MKYEKTKNYLHMNMRKKNRIMRQLSAAVFLSACLGLTGGCTEEEEYTQGQWWRRSDFDGYARMYASSFTIGNQGYMCCGYRGSNRDYLKDLWVYDTDGNYWTQLSDMPEEAQGRHSAAAFALDGKGYVTTGQIKNDLEYLADTWEYDPSTDTWTRMDDFAGGARGGALAFSLGGYGYVGTGYDDNFTPLSNVHNNSSGASSRYGAVSFSTGTRGFVLLGGSGGSSYFDDVYELLPYDEEKE